MTQDYDWSHLDIAINGIFNSCCQRNTRESLASPPPPPSSVFAALVAASFTATVPTAMVAESTTATQIATINPHSSHSSNTVHAIQPPDIISPASASHSSLAVWHRPIMPMAPTSAHSVNTGSPILPTDVFRSETSISQKHPYRRSFFRIATPTLDRPPPAPNRYMCRPHATALGPTKSSPFYPCSNRAALPLCSTDAAAIGMSALIHERVIPKDGPYTSISIGPLTNFNDEVMGPNFDYFDWDAPWLVEGPSWYKVYEGNAKVGQTSGFGPTNNGPEFLFRDFNFLSQFNNYYFFIKNDSYFVDTPQKHFSYRLNIVSHVRKADIFEVKYLMVLIYPCGDEDASDSRTNRFQEGENDEDEDALVLNEKFECLPLIHLVFRSFYLLVI